MIALLLGLLAGFATPPRDRYRVTPRHNPHAFRRALLRAAMLELKRDPTFAPPPAQHP